MRIIRTTGLLGLTIGLALLIGLTVWSGLEPVRAAIAGIGIGVLLVVLVRAGTASIAAVGWWVLFPPKERPRLTTCLSLRFVREGANALLPLGQVGGDLIGARLLTFCGVPGPLATASVIVDVLVLAVTQALFALTGLVVLVALGVDPTLAWIAGGGLLLAMPMLVGFWLAQRRGGRAVVVGLLGRFRGAWAKTLAEKAERLFVDLSALHASRSRMGASVALHYLDWLTGIGEVFVAFYFMGHPVSLAEALVIESLMHAIRGAAFAIPGALGAQEAGLVALCAVFGIPPDQAIALSLVKRVADLATGVPGLAIWQWMEGRRWRGRRTAAAPGSASDAPAAGVVAAAPPGHAAP
ncbi:putative integral membrane protein [Rhodovulum sp. PH10]|uniref:lysylphosphatidylglycerol synthase domain-containing protein n=1 Tax=Rhodovulum sp. PH10 TaxID=1187851 RepID=UPI00027C1F6D|nr:lysylphosphatidylglycerol synthase domain-containing protein [Rhodovulum sp. PH10]EJW09361.1 putative integral membrane protein [Rhodovulum sp. PH10]